MYNFSTSKDLALVCISSKYYLISLIFKIHHSCCLDEQIRKQINHFPRYFRRFYGTQEIYFYHMDAFTSRKLFYIEILVIYKTVTATHSLKEYSKQSIPV